MLKNQKNTAFPTGLEPTHYVYSVINYTFNIIYTFNTIHTICVRTAGSEE